MSSFATLFAMERKYGVKALLNSQQFEVLSSYFSLDALWPNTRLLELHYPSWKDFTWNNPFL
jgi:hypothetical protein